MFRRQWFAACAWGMWRDRSWDISVKDAWPPGPTPQSWDHYLCEEMRTHRDRRGRAVLTRGQHIGVTGSTGHGLSIWRAEWEAQQFTADIPPQAYREVPRAAE